MSADGIHGLRKAETECESYFGGRWHKNKIRTGTSNGVGLTLTEPVQLSYFKRDKIRGYSDDFERRMTTPGGTYGLRMKWQRVYHGTLSATTCIGKFIPL